MNSYEHNEIVSFRRLIRRPPAPKISIQLIIHFVCPRITYITRDCTYLSTLASRRSPLPRLLVASGYSSSNWIVSLTENHPTFSLCRVVSPRSLSWVWLSQWGCSEHKSPPPSSPPSPFPGIYFAGGSCLQLFSGATLKLNPTARFRIHVRVCVHIVHVTYLYSLLRVTKSSVPKREWAERITLAGFVQWIIRKVGGFKTNRPCLKLFLSEGEGGKGFPRFKAGTLVKLVYSLRNYCCFE